MRRGGAIRAYTVHVYRVASRNVLQPVICLSAIDVPMSNRIFYVVRTCVGSQYQEPAFIPSLALLTSHFEMSLHMCVW